MKRITCKGFIIGLLILLSTGQISAQYLFTQSFSNAGVLAKSGWYLGSAHNTTFRDTVNGYMVPGQGSVHVSFTDLASGDRDTLKLPVFTTSGPGDSLRFDHAHRGKAGRPDSMSVFYSTNSGTTMQLLKTFAGSTVPDSSTLSTVYSATASGKYKPDSSADWSTKTIALPSGTNAIMFVFYSRGGDELYLDNILIGQDPGFCTGPPVLTVASTMVLACPGSSFYLAPDSIVVNPLITYEWKRSLDNGATDPWTTATNGYGANSPEFYLANFSQAYWYRLEATCGSLSASPSIHVQFDSLYNCYCRTNLGGFCNTWITGVTLGSNLSTTTTCPGGNSVFTFYPPATGTTDSLTAGDPYSTISVGTGLLGAWLKARVGFWIDYNRDGMYDTTEFNMIKTDAATETNTYQFKVPANAATGLTGLRVRAVESGSFLPLGSFQLMDGRHACTNGTSGEVEEYLVYMKPFPGCTAMPVAGSVKDTLFTVCPGTSLTFRVDGASFGNGITYQWEQSSDNGNSDPWHSITGWTGLSYTTPAMTSQQYFRLKVECANSAMSAYTSSIAVQVNPFYTCYCSSNLGGSKCNASTAYISNVSVSNTTINNSTGCSNNASSYSAYDTSATTSDTVYNSQIITINVTNTQYASRVAVWIDYDHSGTYDASEFTLITPASVPNVASAGLVQIPATALNGLTGMRVRIVNAGWGLDSVSACSNFSVGETEDYLINIQPAPSCSGTPAAGSYPLAYSICSGTGIAIDAPGADFGPAITYRWQQATDGISWVDVSTGTGYDSRNFQSAALTDSMYYRLSVTCTNSGQTGYGDPVKVSIKPFYTCYCTSDLGAGYSCTSNEYISNVSFPGRNFNVTSSCNTPTFGNSYTFNAPAGAATDSITAGDEVIMSARTQGSFAWRIAVWIDYDHNGVFEKSEYTLVNSYASPGNTVTGTIIPAVNAASGFTGMRVRATNYTAPLDSADACTNLGDGETEDYVIYIRPAVPCNSTASAGTLPSTMLMCPGKGFTIIPAGVTVGSGISYFWQESDDNGASDAWDAISGSANTKTVNISGITQSRYYRLKVICAYTSDSSFSNSMQVLIDTFYNCYDANTDLGGGACINNDYISNVSIDGTTLDNTSACNNTPKGARTVFPASGNTTATLVAGMTYTINVTPTFVKSMGVWIDYNRNGVYEASEFKLINQRSNVKSSAAFSVPPNAVMGLTGMRVRTNEPRAISFPAGGITGGQAATKLFQGETEDYVILIDSLKPATGVTAVAATSSEVIVSWTNGNGDTRLVVAKDDTTALALPVDGKTYRGGTIFGLGDTTGAGNHVVYAGDRGTSVTVEGLDSSRTYNFYVYEYINASKKYFTPGEQASASPLPVDLLAFEGMAINDHAHLSWATASERNNSGFEIERSADGNNFAPVAFVKGKGHSASVTRYSHTDRHALQGVSHWFYRLKQVDFNGAYVYSQTILVRGKETSGLAIINPNPFQNDLRISLPGNRALPAIITLHDVLGNVVRTQSVEAGQNDISIETSDLANGVYFVSVEAGKELYRYKVVKSDNVK